MIKKLLLPIIAVSFLAACGGSNDPEPDEQIIGTWTDEQVSITFETDLTYGEKSLIDNPLDTANLDSTFGIYYSDKENRVISFTIKGYKLENGTVLDSASIGQTWVYTISEVNSQTVMNYQSGTAIGSLTKIE